MSAGITQVDSVDALRSEAHTHRIFTVDEAIEFTRCVGILTLSPLYGGIPPESHGSTCGASPTVLARHWPAYFSRRSAYRPIRCHRPDLINRRFSESCRSVGGDHASEHVLGVPHQSGVNELAAAPDRTNSRGLGVAIV